MSDISVKDAKKTYIETGRLNRNIIDKEVSISWYKCKLQNMSPKDNFRIINEEIKNPFDAKFINYIDSIILDHFQFIIANKSLQVCSKRITDQKLKSIQSIDDLCIGTNGGYISQKIHLSHQVKYDEHYLDLLSSYCTCGIVLTDSIKTFGTLMIISELKIEEYEVAKINELLSKYYAKEEFDVVEYRSENLDNNELHLSNMLAYPTVYFDEFSSKLSKIVKMGLPIVIKGEKGTGKSILASYLLLKSNLTHSVVILSNSNKTIHRQLIEAALFHNETVVLENIEYISDDSAQLLTAYSELILTKGKHSKYSNYKCSTLIMTTVNIDDNSEIYNINNRVVFKLLEKLSMSTVNLVNSNYFMDDIDELIDKISKRYPYKMSQSFRNHVLSDLVTLNYKTTVENIEISMNNHVNNESKILLFHVNDVKQIPKTLEQIEYEHIKSIYEMMDHNIAATADVLEIGRTTLYRKLEKMKVFQNETK